jgi:aldehyde:ferredoxin oxidoreductase
MVFKVPDGIVSAVSNFCSAISGHRRASRQYYGRYQTSYMKVMGLIDGSGVSTHDIDFIVNWLRGCYQAGLLREEETGVSFQDFGSYEFYEGLIRRIVDREGFGDLMAEGAHRASDSLGKLGKEFINDPSRGFKESYQPRIIPTSALLAAFESNGRLSLYHTWPSRIFFKHAEEPNGRGWLNNGEWVSRIREIFGTDKVIDHSEEGFYRPDKAFLAKWTEDYKTAGAGCFILCDWVMGHFWSWYSDKPNRGEPSAENESWAYALVTGHEMDVAGMLKVGERVRNVERMIAVRKGRRRADDTLADYCFNDFPAAKAKGKVPGPDGHWIAVERALDREKWEKLKDAYYTQRGWDLQSGIPTRAKLEALDLKDIADGLQDNDRV